MSGNPWGVPEPTSEQCTAVAPVEWTDPRGNVCRGFAIWYPQMGGYVGKAVVEPSWNEGKQAPGCFEAYVWHDGEFPFSDDAERPPVKLHHCMPEQFIEFGKKVAELSGLAGVRRPTVRPLDELWKAGG